MPTSDLTDDEYAAVTAGQEEPGMFDLFERYPQFLEAHRYASLAHLLPTQ